MYFNRLNKIFLPCAYDYGFGSEQIYHKLHAALYSDRTDIFKINGRK